MMSFDITHSRYLAFVSFTLGLVLTTSGCFQGDSDNDNNEVCPDGNWGCPCYGNGTCNNELICSSNMCQSKESGSLGTGGSNSSSVPTAGVENSPGFPTMEELVAGCTADLTCVWTDYPDEQREAKLRRQGEDCILYVPAISTILRADSTTNSEYYPSWNLSEGVITVCNAAGGCTFICDLDGYVNVPCTGEMFECISLSPEQCGYMEGCSIEDGRCSGYGASSCGRYPERTVCEQQGCTWTE